MTCSFPIDYGQCGNCEPLASMPASGKAVYEQMAVDYLRNWTSPSLGICDVVVRPCRQGCEDGRSTFWGSGPFPFGGYPFRPVVIDGLWWNLGCGICGDKCSCSSIEQITLPGPVYAIESIQIDGIPVPSGAYRVDNHKYLVRTDGGVWPDCQNMNLPDGDVGTWSISYWRGMSVPVGGQIAAGVLACELAKAACGDKTCGLPQRVQSITRQGVTVAVLDAFDDIDSGHTGIWLIDSWIASMTKPRSPSQVFSPDLPREPARRQTWPFTDASIELPPFGIDGGGP